MAESKAAPGALEALLDWGRTEMTMYLPTGKKKHARWFWIDAETKKLCWSKTQDGKANKSEPLISVLDEIKVPSAKELFDEVDDDGNGYLDMGEVAQLYRRARGQKLTKPELKVATEEMDANGDNQITFDEFEPWWEKSEQWESSARRKGLTIVCQDTRSGSPLRGSPRRGKERVLELLLAAPDDSAKKKWVEGLKVLVALVAKAKAEALEAKAAALEAQLLKLEPAAAAAPEPEPDVAMLAAAPPQPSADPQPEPEPAAAPEAAPPVDNPLKLELVANGDHDGDGPPEPEEAKPIDAPAKTKPSSGRHAGFRRRALMYFLQCFFVLILKSVRAGIPMLAPIVSSDLGFSDSQNAMVISGFFQGYIITQVPAAPIVQAVGPKIMLTGAMTGTAILFVLAPILARSTHAATMLMFNFMLMGMIQGPLAPAMSQINAAWLPGGIEQVWAFRCSPSPTLSHVLWLSSLTARIGAGAQSHCRIK